jgi:predicted glycoside hydrolase/deacetylase ChbG (UPF0249 family)
MGATVEQLGFGPDARVLILNLDDFGMYEPINRAVVRAIEDGIGSSCSLMPPGPGAADAMRSLRERPHIPFGIHLTLFCDLPGHRWGPLSDPRAVPSLLDRSGALYGPDHVADLLAQARIEQVETEFRRQIETVVRTGLAPTHLDWHCLADGGRPDIFELTLALADEYGLAVRAWLEPARRRLRSRGRPTVDHDFLDSFRLDLDHKTDRYLDLLRRLPPGLTEWAVHPGLADGHARTNDPGWRVRATDYDFLVSSEARRTVENEHIVLTDYRTIQRIARSAPPPPTR